MKSRRLTRLERWGIGALSLVIHCVVAPGLVRAGCSDHVTSHSDRRFEFDRLDPLILGDRHAAVSFDMRAEDKGSNRPLPCSGPRCSSRAPVPIPAAVNDTDRSDQWGYLTGLIVVPRTSPPVPIVEGPTPRPTAVKPSIFHPPPR